VIYPDNLEYKIGFDIVRKTLASKCSNPLGKAECESMTFSNNYRLIVNSLSQTNEYLSIIKSTNDFPNGSIFDLRESLLKIKAAGSFLTETELYQLGKTLVSAAEICDYFTEEKSAAYPLLKQIADSLLCFPEISRHIDSILDKFGNIKDNASPELQQLRRKLLSVSSSVNGMMQRVISRYKQIGMLDKDCTPSIRDGRLVIPVAPMHKRAVKGIVHDESATGKTFFIEPEEIVEANNQIRELEADIHKEIVRILIMTADIIRPHLDDLTVFYQTIGVFDFIRAKALFANEIDATMPQISQKPEIEWYNAVHPVLFMTLSKLGKNVVPLSIQLDNKNHILLISGPNAGGKSVCLKTVGVVQYMFQCGILPPVYSNSHFGIFDNIFIDIGDEQSIENELSTYSSHLSNMNYFMRHSNSKTLLLIDEFGGGTEPQIGGAIAQAILKKLNDSGSFGVITTHYQNLKNFANETDGIVNGAMLYDRNLMQPLFQLSIGTPGSSFAIEIARKIGIPSDVISYAEDIVGSDYINMDKYLLDIARDRRYWQNKRQDVRLQRKKLETLVEKYETDIQKLVVERREIIKEAKSEAKEILSHSNASIENAIHEIKKVQAEKERTKEVRRQIDDLKKRLSTEGETVESSEKLKELSAKLDKRHKKRDKASSSPQIKAEEPLSVGDTVTVDGSNSVGEIIAIEGKNATVAMGLFKSKVPLSKLKKTIRKATAATQTASFVSSSTSDNMRSRQLEFKQEIDVRGMRADEALQAVSYFIDDAVQFNIKQIRILHGTGYGILRQRIREYLNTVPDVKSYRDEHVQFGGAGITVVELS
jgi:DNA mismatch repair protein MutS2